MKYIAKTPNKEFKITLENQANNALAKINGKTIPVELTEINGSHTFSGFVGNRSLEVEITKSEGDYLVYYRGRTIRFNIIDERTAHLRKSTVRKNYQRLEKELKAPMPGLVVRLEVEAGQKVLAGDGLLIIEAMKMENEIKAPFDATIKAIQATVGQAVEMNQVLVVFE